MANERDSGHPSTTPNGGWVPVPDPTLLTTEAVTRATDIFRREIQALRELHDKDLSALRELIDARAATQDQDRTRLWDHADDIIRRFTGALTEFREEVKHRDTANLKLIEQRLADLDKSRADGYATLIEKALAEREFITGQIGTVSAVMAEKFSAVDGRFEESKVAVDAAFAAAKEAVAEQNKSNAREIGKSETATKEQLASLSRVTDAGIAGLSDKISDARDRLTSIESLTRGIEQAGGEGRATRNERRMDNSQIIAIISTILFLISIAITIVVATHGR